jgi:hypothetical protein
VIQGWTNPYPASFRDRSGHIFQENSEFYRYIAPSFRAEFDRLGTSGLFEELVGDGLLLPHALLEETPDGGRILKPQQLDFMSYPYEWCFGQLQAAARATLEIQRRALFAGMTLKDASAFNVPIHRGRPVLIDLLSLETWNEGEPWAAYRQFCEHFLAPLALMASHGQDAGRLWKTHVDGIPLPLASKLLPWKTRLSPGLAAHIHAHAAQQARAGGVPTTARAPQISKNGLLGIIDHLDATVRGLTPPKPKTAWSHYYDETNYEREAMDAKVALVGKFLDAVTPAPKTVWDFGANDGRFSRLASEREDECAALDIDPEAVERAWSEVASRKETKLLPLVMDLSDPSAARGWAGQERESLLQRGPADIGLALALVHHLAIGHNVPLGKVAEFFARACKMLIVEFVPKEDSQVKRMLATRKDIFDDYHQAGFESAFESRFERLAREPIPGAQRTLYLLRRREG